MSSRTHFIPAAWVIGGLTLGSRVLGLLRECIFGYYFSTSELMSAFRIAFMVPNLSRRLFGEGALSSSMVPVLTKSLQTQGEQASRRFVGSLLTALLLVLGGITLLIELGIAVWRMVQDDPALELTAIMLPYMVLVCIVAAASGVLNVRGHFAVPAASPIILNIGIITGALGGSFWAGLCGLHLVYVVCACVLVSGVIQLAASGAALRAVSFFPIFGRQVWDPQIRTVMALMGPMILGLSAVQVNSLVDYVIAYLFVTENGERVGPAVLGYAQFLYQLPLGVFGISIATAIFPELSRKCAEQDRHGMADVFERGIRLNLFVSLPASVGLMYVARPLVAALYERGQFDAADTRRVAWTLLFYSIGIVAYFTQHIVIRAFYALHNSKTPANAALCMVVLNFLMNITLVFAMEERGLALATAVCAIVQVVYLSRRLSRDVPEIQWRRIARGASGMVGATVIMAMVLTLAMWPTLGGRLIPSYAPVRLIVLVALGAGAYAAASRVLRVEELTAALRGGRGLGLE